MPHCLRDHTNQSIRKSIRKNDPIDTNPELETKTDENDWLSQKSEIPHNRFGGSNRTWESKEGIQRPADRNQKAQTRAYSNSEFHGDSLPTRMILRFFQSSEE
jgi:hypothetical protein